MSGKEYDSITLNINQEKLSNKSVSNYNKKRILNKLKEKPQTINKDLGLFKRFRINKKYFCGMINDC